MSESGNSAARCPTIRVMMMPRDTNAQGTIFGGVILSCIDQAGTIQARRFRAQKYVTVAMDQVEFKKPVYVGDVLDFYTEVIRVGRTSLTIRVWVEAERFADPSQRVPVTEATLVYVAIDDEGRPIPVRGDDSAGS